METNVEREHEINYRNNNVCPFLRPVAATRSNAAFL
jgi:hypothetical protein